MTSFVLSWFVFVFVNTSMINWAAVWSLSASFRSIVLSVAFPTTVCSPGAHSVAKTVFALSMLISS